MKKLIWLLLLGVLVGCVSTGLSKRDTDEFDKWRERRDRDRQENRPINPRIK